MSINSAAAPTLAALIIQLGLGVAVFQANPQRKPNQCFLLLSGVIGVWLSSLGYSVFSGGSTEIAAFYIRQASASGAFILTAANFLRLSIQEEDPRWGHIIRDSWIWLVGAIVIAIFCQTDAFLIGARFSRPPDAQIALPVPVYGKASFAYALYFIFAALALIYNYSRDARKAVGIRRTEFSFIFTGVAAALATVVVPFVLGFFVDRSRLVWIAPFRILLFSLIVAYGIATQKIMDVGLFLRRAMSYIVLGVYLLVLYGLVWWLVFRVFSPVFGPSMSSLAHVAGALTVAFAMAPAKGFSQTLADRLFAGTRRLDFQATMRNAANILRSVSTLSQLLEKFARTIEEAVDTERVIILLPNRGRFLQLYPPVEDDGAHPAIELDRGHAVVAQIEKEQTPIVLDELHRVRATPELALVRTQMEALKSAVAIGIFSREHLAGIMLLGPRLSGRIYGTGEQNALQVLSGQLAVAIENARLFTEVQNAKLYNETLLENLTSGVIAV
ncbi:MAG: GAF domain-containing protein, partial [Chthoniobacterales bacterium]